MAKLSPKHRGPSVPRREFLVGAGATVAIVAFGTNPSARGAQPAAPAPPTADGLVAGKDPRLTVHTPRPAVLETPAELLLAQRITPPSLLFVRNNQQPSNASTIKPLAAAGWKIEVAGNVDAPRTIDAGQLAALPQVEHEMVLQCSGNGRKLFASAPVKGTRWGRGGMGNVRFAGVSLAALIDHLGIKINPAARFLTASGLDEPPPGEQDFEHSLPLDEAMKKSFLSLRMGGEALPAVHGGPVRLVTPGYFGTMHIKWVNRLQFAAQESNHKSHVPDYRTPRNPIKPGEAFSANLENSEPNWRMKIKCVVLSPAPGAQIASEVLCQGVAFNDGEAKITSVLVSADEGATWQAAKLEIPESPYAWYRWQAALKLPAGKRQIWAQAIDALGRTQPLEGTLFWNPQGYTWNGVERIDVTVG